MPVVVVAIEKLCGLKRIEIWLAVQEPRVQNWRKPSGTEYRILEYWGKFGQFRPSVNYVPLPVGFGKIARYLVLGDERDVYMVLAQLPNRLLAFKAQLPY
jgi:hypothetical protein